MKKILVIVAFTIVSLISFGQSDNCATATVINLDPSVIIAMGKNGRDLLEKKFDQEKINKYTKMEIHQLIYA